MCRSIVVVSDSDRAYFERIGVHERESHAEARTRHVALSRTSGSSAGAFCADKYAATTTPSAFYARARALGLCDP